MKLLKYTLIGTMILTSGLLFSFAGHQTPQAQANSLIRAFSGGVAEGLASCAAQKVGNAVFNKVSSTVKSKVSDAIPGTAVPVSDAKAQEKLEQSKEERETRETCLDGIAYATAQNMLDQLADSTLGWVQSGFTKFGQTDNPAYIGDLEGFVANVGEQTFNQFAEEYSRTNPSGVCNFFSDSVLLSVTNDYLANNRSPSGLQPSDVLNGFNPSTSDGCGLETALGEEDSKAFLEGDFSAGGWQAFLHASQDPGSNPIGAYLSQKSELNSRIQQERELGLQELENNSGWLSEISCPGNAQSLDSTTGQCRNPDGSLSEPVIKTPGTVVNETVNNMIGSDFRRLELADEVNEIVTALASMLVANLTGSGGDNYSGGFFGSDLANQTSALSNINDYSQGSYNGPVSEEFIASTTADQIALEEEILSIITQLPTRYDLRSLEARLNQCLADGDITGEGFENSFSTEIENVIRDIFIAYDSVFPGSNTNEEREIGPQKINWAGNNFDWEKDTIYGNRECEEGEHRLRDIDNHKGKGIGNISFAYSATEAKWRGYICAKKNFDGLGVDTVDVELFSIEEYAGRSIAGGELNNNIEEYINLDGYRPPRNHLQKIDWNGGEYDWEYYNLFADGIQLLRLNESIFSDDDQLIWISSRNNINEPLRGTGGDLNRYGAGECREQTEGAVSWIVKPGEKVWTQQICQHKPILLGSFIVPDLHSYYFISSGQTRAAFKEKSDQIREINAYALDIRDLIGNEDYDDSYQEPLDGDDLRELLNDVQTITAGNPTSAELSARKEAIDARFGRLAIRFHSEADLQAARQALRLFTETDDSPDYNYPQLLQYANANNCQLPDDWDNPTVPTSGGGSGSGNGPPNRGVSCPFFEHETYKDDYTPPTPVYEKPQSVATSPAPGKIQVGVIFLGMNFVIRDRTRVWLNNTEYDFREWGDNDGRWDFWVIEHPQVGQARGELIELDKELARVYIPKVDIWMEGANNHGFGNATYKVLTKADSFDYNQITQEHEGSPMQGWATTKPGAGGVLISRNGWNGTFEPNPDFNNFVLPDGMKDGVVKYLIVIGGATGDNACYPNDWHPKP